MKGGDKQNFWQNIMELESAEAIRQAILAEISLKLLQPQGQNAWGDREDPDSFIKTIGVETVSPEQLSLVKPAKETVGVRAQLLTLLEDISENSLEEVKDFAEFLLSKQRKAMHISS